MLPKVNRLRKEKEFERIFNAGRWGGGMFISLKYAKNEDGDAPKIGFMVGSKVSKSSVKRNVAKRKMREVVRKLSKNGKINTSFDFIVIAKPEIVGKVYHEIEEDIKFSLNKAKILK